MSGHEPTGKDSHNIGHLVVDGHVQDQQLLHWLSNATSKELATHLSAHQDKQSQEDFPVSRDGIKA